MPSLTTTPKFSELNHAPSPKIDPLLIEAHNISEAPCKRHAAITTFRCGCKQLKQFFGGDMVKIQTVITFDLKTPPVSALEPPHFSLDESFLANKVLRAQATSSEAGKPTETWNKAYRPH